MDGMSGPLVIFDLGHTGATRAKPAAEWEGLREDLLVAEYAFWALLGLRKAGVDATYSGPGLYEQRQERARELGAKTYIACHVNAGSAALREAGNPRNNAAYYDWRSPAMRSPLLANGVLQACQKRFGTFPCGTWKAREARAGHWTSNALHLIAYTGNAAAITFEPGFIDEPDHQLLWTPSGLKALGEGLAEGILTYLGHSA